MALNFTPPSERFEAMPLEMVKAIAASRSGLATKAQAEVARRRHHQLRREVQS